MKKLFSVFTAFIIFAAIFTSCEKQGFEETKSENQKVLNFNTFDLTVKNNMLSFASVENFDNALTYLAEDEQNNFENWNKKSEFNSMAVTFKNTKEEMPADDEILANFLNADGTVEIQGKIFKLDFEKKIVLVYENNEAYLNNKYSKTYTFDDEVLTLEFGTEEEIAEMNNTEYAKNITGSKGTIYAPYIAGIKTTLILWEGGIYSDWIKSQPTYYKYGITNILKAKMWTNISLNSKMTMTAYNKCTWKNKNEKEQSRNSGLLLSDYKNITYTFYSRSKRLVCFDIDITFHYDYMNHTMDTTNGIFWTDAN